MTCVAPLRVVIVVSLAASAARFVRAESAPVGALTIAVTGLHSDRGQVGCSLYNSAIGFPTDRTKAQQTKWCSIAGAASRCAFDAAPAGTYAVICIHDENKNGKLDRGAFGIPKEGVVASNHAKGFMGPPSFKDAKFSFSGVASAIELKMAY